MKTYPLRPKRLDPYSIMRTYKDEEGLTRPFDLIEGAKTLEKDICPKCFYYHEDCPKPEYSENIAIAYCGDFKEKEMK